MIGTFFQMAVLAFLFSWVKSSCVEMVQPEKIQEKEILANNAEAQYIAGASTSQPYFEIGPRSNDYFGWTGGVVYFYVDDYDPVFIDDVYEAVRFIEDHTCITLNEVEASDDNHKIRFTNIESAGCYSYVGYMNYLWLGKVDNGYQDINIAYSSCSQPRTGIVPSIVHEIMHALGIDHTHKRPDRDDYIDMVYDYISPQSRATASQYKKLDATTYTIYEYQSIMHYGSGVFSNGIDFPMLRKDGTFISDPDQVTRTDMVVVNSIYCRSRLSEYPNIDLPALNNTAQRQTNGSISFQNASFAV
eukprot:Awhi_evm1s2523